MKLKLLLSNKRGRIFEHPHLEPCGMEGGAYFRLDPRELIKLPGASRLFMLPEREPVGYDPQKGKTVVVEDFFAVSAFLSPGHTGTFSSAYKEKRDAKMLPLFSYTAAASYKGGVYAAAIKVDNDRRHDTRFIDIGLVKKSASKMRKEFPRNRLISHLSDCALCHGCPGAQNFFLGRYEGPLPTSPNCNALCAGCISYQTGSSCPATQPRIKFIPKPEEVSQVALIHLRNVPNAVVSFGQGCDGEPLLEGGMIEKAIRLIRRSTGRGIINMNTNASKPDTLSRLFDAGLGSIRVSINSAREEYYKLYYRPKGYSFGDVLRSIKIAREKKAYVSINYLTMPGFTDSPEEFAAVKKLVGKYGINMIQWRNLNFDPVLYFKKMKIETGHPKLLGIREVILSLKKTFPRLMTGYFNPNMLKIREAASRHL